MKLANTPAYPHVERNDDGTYWLTHQGLTKRELFAAMAMQGLCAAVGDNPTDAGGWIGRAARRSVWMADALIAELEKTND